MLQVDLKKIVALAMLFTLAACGGVSVPPVGVKIGQPYEVNGKTYYPEADNSYDKTGDASWYGPGFHGKRTASGERFDENDITAAHPTLPMPSLVRVTNLKNDKSVIARINDRGPFHSNRIIDLSKKTAQIIGLKSTQPVRVQYLKKATEEYMTALKAGDTSKLDMAEINSKFVDKPEPEITEIVENSEPQETNQAAPVQLITSNDLAAPSKVASVAKPSLSLIKEARADDAFPSESEEKMLQNKLSGKSLSESAIKESTPHLVAPKLGAKPTAKLVNLSESKKPHEKSVPNGKTSDKNNSGNKLTILAGSFSSEENAKKLAKKIANSGKSSVEKVTVKGKSLWRVQIGNFTDKKKAEKSLESIHNAGIVDARIISK